MTHRNAIHPAANINLETWAVGWWIRDERDAYRYLRSRTATILEYAKESPLGDDGYPEAAVRRLAEELKAVIGADVKRPAFEKVDWPQLARDMIDEQCHAAPPEEPRR